MYGGVKDVRALERMARDGARIYTNTILEAKPGWAEASTVQRAEMARAAERAVVSLNKSQVGWGNKNSLWEEKAWKAAAEVSRVLC